MNKTRDMIAAFEKSATFTSTEATRARRSWRKSPIKLIATAPVKAAVEVALKRKPVVTEIPVPQSPTEPDSKTLPKNAPKSPTKSTSSSDKINTAVNRIVEEQLSNQLRGFSLQHERLEEELLKTQIENEGLKKRQLEMEENLTKLSPISAQPPKPPPKDDRPATQLITTIQTIIEDHEQEKYRDLSAMYAKLRGQQRTSRERYESLRQEHRSLQRKFETFAKSAAEHIGTIEIRLRDLQDKKPYDADTPPPVPKKDNVVDKHDLARMWRVDLGVGMKQMWRELRETKMRCERMMAKLVQTARDRAEEVQSRQSSRRDIAAMSSPTKNESKTLPALPGPSQDLSTSLSSRYGDIYIEADRSQTL